MERVRGRRLASPLGYVAAACLCGALVPGYAALLHVWGRYIPQPEIEADYLKGTLWAIALGAGIFLWPVSERDKRAVLTLWGAKCFVTLGFMLLYEWNYGLDAYGYFNSAQAVLPPFATLGEDGTENMKALTWLHANYLVNAYHAMKVSWAMAGLVAIYLFYRAAVAFSGRENLRLLYILGLYPSILFWSSILGKDPVQFLGVALYFHGVVAWHKSGRIRFLVGAAAGVAIAAFMRTWYIPILLVPFAALLVLRLRSRSAKMFMLVIAMFITYGAVGRIVEQLGVASLNELTTVAESVSAGWEGGSSQQAVEFTGLGSLVAFAPLGAFTALFRPLPGEVMNPFGMLAGLENTGLLVLLALALLRTRLGALRDPLVSWGIFLILVWSGMYGFISYYNMGAAVRFKLQILPALLLVLLYLARRRLPGEAVSHGARAPQSATR